MATFSFRQDVDIIATRMSFYTIEADSLEEAREKMKQYKDTDLRCEGNLEPLGINYLGEKVIESDNKDYMGSTGNFPDTPIFDEKGHIVW